MSKVILKWRYFKPQTAIHRERYLKYIATREGVEKVNDGMRNAPPTRAQTRLIKFLICDFGTPTQCEEYDRYMKTPTRQTATELIDHFMDEQSDRIATKEIYLRYIATRPNVEKIGASGLFTYCDKPINLSAVAQEVAQHDGLVWTTIVSLKREDAQRLGFDNANAWKTLLREKQYELSQAMNIKQADLRWYAAFHNESYHPHIHLVSYSVGSEPYMTQKGLESWKASFANEIFKQDLFQMYAKRTEHRNELRKLGAEQIREIVDALQNGDYVNPVLDEKIRLLAQELQRHKGKMVYGYLSAKCKNMVDAIVKELAKDERIQTLYEAWHEQQEALIHIYSDRDVPHIPLWQNNEFKTIRNAVIREAALLIDREVNEPLSIYDEPIPSAEEAESERTHKPTARQVWRKYDKAKRFLDKNEKDYNPQKAIALLKKIAPISPIACYRLGKLYLGSDDVEADVEQAKEWLTRSAEKGNAYAAYTLGKLLLATDSEKAVSWLTASADKGFEQAEYLLGKFYYQGQFTEKNIEKAIEYLDHATEKGNPYAAYLLGRILLTEESVKDVKEAIHYLKIAHEKGHDYVAFLLGKLYLFGQDIPRDKELGMSFLHASAERGNKYASDLIAVVQSSQSQAVTTGAFRLLSQLAKLIEDKLEKDGKAMRQMVDRKERRKVDELKEARGQRLE